MSEFLFSQCPASTSTSGGENTIGLLEEKQFPWRIPHVVLKVVVNTRYGSTRMKRVCPSHISENQEYRGKMLRAKDTHDHTSREMHEGARWTRWEKPTLTPVLMKWRCICSNALQSFQDLADVVTAIKYTEASKLWRIQRVATLWLEMSPNVPRAAAWSAHSLPKFLLWSYTCCMVSRSLRWARANASCTCVRAWIVPKQIPAACIES